MKNTYKWMFAAILICGLIVSSCKKDPTPTPDPDPEPTTRTVLAGMEAIGVLMFDSVTFSYEYDTQYRLVRSKAFHTPSGFLIRDVSFTYSDGRLSFEGISADDNISFECTLDSEGRITHIDENTILSDNSTMIRHYDYTYDAEGRLVRTFEITEDGGEGFTQDYIWEDGDIRSITTPDSSIVTDFESSDAPAQALFNLIGYDNSFSELCAQGCFGTLPAHMPSKRTLTTTFPIPGMPPVVLINNYTYTLNAEGRLATFEDINESNNSTTSYTLIWEER